MNNNPGEIAQLWKAILTWKAAIGLIISVLLALVVTLPFVTKPVYESEAIVYVPLTIPNQQISQQGVGFAGEHEIDSYIQMLKSNILADSLIKHFGLKTYSTDKTSPIYKQLESKIKIEKTRYGSVSIKVRDNNPDKAAEMANYIINLGESIKRNLLLSNREEALLYSKSLYEEKVEEITTLEKTIDSLEQGGHSSKGNFKYDKVLAAYKLELEEFISRKNQYERAKKDFEAPLPKVYIVSPALALDQKVWPKRGLLCISVAVIYLILIVVIEIIKRDFSKRP